MACSQPLIIKNPTHDDEEASLHPYIEVPCGHCFGCRQSKINRWSNQLEAESFFHNFAIFVTLTFSPENLPEDETPAGVKRIAQLFLKRLRFSLHPQKFRYFLVSEHGDQTLRLHYHCLFYGLRKSQEPEIREAWNQGFILVRVMSLAHIRYVANYITKDNEIYLFSKGLGYRLFADDLASGKLQTSIRGLPVTYSQWFRRSRFSPEQLQEFRKKIRSELVPLMSLNFPELSHELAVRQQKEIDRRKIFELKKML